MLCDFILHRPRSTAATGKTEPLVPLNNALELNARTMTIMGSGGQVIGNLEW